MANGGASGINNTSNTDNQSLITAQNKGLDEDRKMQMEMLNLQRKTNAQNTMFTALTTMEKGKDDVLRSIANNLK